jgi:hypothetical protein
MLIPLLPVVSQISVTSSPNSMVVGTAVKLLILAPAATGSGSPQAARAKEPSRRGRARRIPRV